MCEYSKFRIESNSYLLFDSIRNWRNYSKFSNTYLTVISRAIDTLFVCTLPATSRSRCTRMTLNPVLCRVCSYPSHSPDHTRTDALPCVRACMLPAPCLNRGIWLHYNSGRQTQRMVSWTLALLSVLLWIQLWHGDMLHLKYVVILVLPMWYCRSGSHMPAIDSLTGRPSSATWVVHYTRRMQEIMHKIYFTLL